jgi:uncharacterized protein (TIGR02246 family)
MPISLKKARALAAAYTEAWNSGSAAAVAAHYAETSQIVINAGTPWLGRAGVQAMAEGFFTDVPDLHLICDGVRVAGDHMVYLWTLTGHDAKTVAPLTISGWDEWDLDADHRVKASRGWHDAVDYARQVKGG